MLILFFQWTQDRSNSQEPTSNELHLFFRR